MIPKRKFIVAMQSLAAASLLALTPSTYAQAVSQNIVRLVIPYAAGGGTDILARHFAEALGPELGIRIVVDNKAGGSGNIGALEVKRAAPDGTTLLLGDLAMAVNPSLFKKLPFDPIKDFSPVAMVSTAPLVLVVHKNTGLKTVKDLVQMAKANPGSVTFASAGNGNPPHLAGELFKLTTGADVVHVPYKGVGPGLNDLLGGHVFMMFTGISSTKSHIDSGNLTALAVTGSQRASTLPNVPTITEAGFPAADVTSWWALYAPANTPSKEIDRITRATERALKNPTLLENLAKQNILPSYGNQDVLRTKLRGETDKWAQVIKSAKITAD